MTAIKKKITKASKAPAPAPKASVSEKKVPAAAKAVPAVAAVRAQAVVTTITARIDVGFGNALYVRGYGPGLSWDSGVPMACIKPDEWQLTLGETVNPITFKVLLNDSLWSSGVDFVVTPGSRVNITPSFQG